jgi:glycosyltransferase involved in cell wall biosynthesis
MTRSFDANAVHVPVVSILIPAYNAGLFVEEAMKAMLAQTWTDFELVIIDDGSTDDTYRILEKIADQDSRVRLVKNEQNMGLIATLNRGLQMATGKYIARMDADDYSPPQRLSLQVAYLESHQRTVAVGSNGLFFGKKTGAVRVPQHANAVRTRLVFDNPILHSSILMRREWLAERGIQYRSHLLHSEDYDFWVQIVEAGGEIENLPEQLLHYRIHGTNVTQTKRQLLERTSGDIRRRQMASLGCTFSQQEINILDNFMFEERYRTTVVESAIMRSIHAKLTGLPLPIGRLNRRYEAGRFIVSLFSRPRSLQHKIKLFVALSRINAITGAVFTVMFALRRP